MLAQTAHTLGEEMRCAVGSRLNDQIWRMASTGIVHLGAHSTLGFIHSAVSDWLVRGQQLRAGLVQAQNCCLGASGFSLSFGEQGTCVLHSTMP